ncbi:hypothetical protein Q2T48_34020, partial [Pseudomonas aeruginosa]|uniref:hypothetical protein n=1 Tax=Pseudomonas aeruginosa TaxID=287 RepID=UPI00265FFE41
AGALDSADETRIDLVALGNPHFSASEFAQLAALADAGALDSADETRIDLVALGNPHFSASEFAQLAAL